MIAIIDYGVGNLFSLVSSFKAIGADTVITGDIETIKKADKLILPGVGAFCDAIKKLRETSLDKVLIEQAQNGKPVMGICLGMQMLFEKSYEYGEHEGLGLIKGEIRPIEEVIPKNLKVPHIGWNALKFTGESKLFKYIKDGDFVYFVHSYYINAENESDVSAYTRYGEKLGIAVERENVFATQFHPEKSGDTGMKILKNFIEL